MDMICDFPATATSQVLEGTVGSVANADQAFVANWDMLLVAMWGGLDIVVDQYTKLGENLIRIVGHYLVDCGFAYDDAFVMMQRTA